MKQARMLLVALVTASISVGSSGCWEGAESGRADRGYEDEGAGSDFWEEFWEEFWAEVANQNGGDGDSEGDWYQHCHVKPYVCEDIGDSMAHQSFGCCFDTIHYWCEYDINGSWELVGLECAEELEGGFCDKGADGIDCFQ